MLKVFGLVVDGGARDGVFADRVEALWRTAWKRRRHGAWSPAGPFGASFDLDDALAFITPEPTFWIRA